MGASPELWCQDGMQERVGIGRPGIRSGATGLTGVPWDVCRGGVTLGSLDHDPASPTCSTTQQPHRSHRQSRPKSAGSNTQHTPIERSPGLVLHDGRCEGHTADDTLPGIGLIDAFVNVHGLNNAWFNSTFGTIGG